MAAEPLDRPSLGRQLANGLLEAVEELVPQPVGPSCSGWLWPRGLAASPARGSRWCWPAPWPSSWVAPLGLGQLRADCRRRQQELQGLEACWIGDPPRRGVVAGRYSWQSQGVVELEAPRLYRQGWSELQGPAGKRRWMRRLMPCSCCSWARRPLRPTSQAHGSRCCRSIPPRRCRADAALLRGALCCCCSGVVGACCRGC